MPSLRSLIEQNYLHLCDLESKKPEKSPSHLPSPFPVKALEEESYYTFEVAAMSSPRLFERSRLSSVECNLEEPPRRSNASATNVQWISNGRKVTRYRDRRCCSRFESFSFLRQPRQRLDESRRVSTSLDGTPILETENYSFARTKRSYDVARR